MLQLFGECCSLHLLRVRLPKRVLERVELASYDREDHIDLGRLLWQHAVSRESRSDCFTDLPQQSGLQRAKLLEILFGNEQ